MQRLNDILSFYLKSESNFSIMITGEWGVGKTYYFKNELKQLIEKTPVFSDNSKKYKPLIISLFGLKSIEEIQSEIFLSLYPILKNKSIKLSASVGKAVIKGFMNLKNIGNYSDFVEEIDIEKSEWINFNELVLCFDDLERLSKNLNIEELIGYLNSLVENQNIKIILIANENKIEEKSYHILKEKIVGNTIEFIPNLGNTYDSLIKSKFQGYSQYIEFLKNNKDYILEVFKANSSNLRTLSFALTYFQVVFSTFRKEILEGNYLKTKEPEILKNLIKFTLSISIEYKLGNISFTNQKELDRNSRALLIDDITLENFGTPLNFKEKETKKKSYRQEFIEQFYKENDFVYFESIYSFITGGDIFNFDKLVNQLKSIYHLNDNKVLPHYEILNSLKYQFAFSLTQKEYNNKTRKLLKYSEKGLFELTDYTTIFSFITRFGNPLNYKLSKLEKRIIFGMKKGISNYNYFHNLDFHIEPNRNSENYEILMNIRQVAIDLNNQVEKNNLNIEIKELEKDCYENFELFLKNISDNNKKFVYTPLFKEFNVNYFYSFILKSNNDLRWEIIRLFKNRYKENPSSLLKPELQFLNKLKVKTRKKLNSLPKTGISRFIFKELDSTIETSIKRLEKVLN